MNDQSYMPEGLKLRSDLSCDYIFQSDSSTDESFNHQLAGTNLDTNGSIQHITRLMNEKTKNKEGWARFHLVGQDWSSSNFLSL